MAKKREEKKRSEEKQAKEVEKRLKAEHDELVKPKPADVETTALSQINPDWDMAPRGVEAAHVKDLAASIRNQGLLEPLIIDRNGLLLAGQHRFSALRHLRDEDRGLFERWFPKSQIPVLRLDIDAHEDTQVAVAAAVAENQKRQGLSRETINQFRDKIIRKLNLRSGSGRPRKGTPPLGPLLSEAFRLSPRQIRRIRNGMGQNKPGRSDRVSSPAATAERILSATLRGGNISDDEWASMPLLKRAVALLSAIGLHEEDMAVLGKWCKQPPNVREQQVDDGSLWGQ